MKKLLQLLIIFSALPLLTALYLITDGLTDSATQAEGAVILGNTVNPDGTLSARLQGRLDKGIELYRQQRVKFLIVSGARGKEGWNEAIVMATYLNKQGIPPLAVISDTLGFTTRRTAINVARICDSLNISSLIIVSQYFHLPRCQLAFRQTGFCSTSTAKADYYELRDLFSITREIAAFYSYLLKL